MQMPKLSVPLLESVDEFESGSLRESLSDTLYYPGQQSLGSKEEEECWCTDDSGIIVEQRHDELQRASNWWMPLVLYGSVLVMAAAFMSVPLCNGGEFHWAVLEFGLVQLWVLPAVVGTATWLYACCPSHIWRSVVPCALVGFAASPLFWLMHYGAVGTLAQSNPQFLPYHMVVLLPIFAAGGMYCIVAERHPSPHFPPRPGQKPRALYGFLVVAFWSADYALLIAFLQWVETKTEMSGLERIGFSALFMVTTQVTKSIGKRLGVAVDRTKSGTFSIYFSIEFTATLFYYTFYRSLFDGITVVWEFIALILIHTFQEWMLNVLLATEWAFQIYLWFHRHSHPWTQKALALWLPPGCRTLRDMQSYSATEVGMNASAAIFASSGYFIILFLAHYHPWTRQQYRSEGNEGNLWTALIYIAVATGIEAINTALMQYLFFAKHGLSVMVWSARIFSQPGIFANNMAVCLCLLINIIYPLIDYDCTAG